MSILEVHNVSIRYMTGDFKEIGLKEYAMRKLKGNYQVNEFWADKDVSFTLEKGDMLGIIGSNGAGKSTLLKTISGIMEPTGGWVRREGSIAALLELASGFDGDLTVRENAYLRGAMLGYTRKFMDEKYDQIIDFAELQDFQGRTFKQLSSGMKSRLAFSIASLVEPDILILDEVLSVGDGAFRKKSEAKMREIITGGATTILVSHSIAQVRKLCTKVLWLEKGRQIAYGENVEEICDQYQCFLEGKLKLEETDADSHSLVPEASQYRFNDGENGGETAMEENRTKFIWPELVNPWRRISQTVKTAFFSACFFGVLTHIYIFTNLILNHDSVRALLTEGDGLQSGRWSLRVLSDFSTRFQLPVVIAVISIVMLALTAGITVSVLGISNRVTAVLVSAFLVTIPSVACIFSYMFTADAYFICLFLNALAVYVVKKYKWGWTLAIFLCAVACGGYQAFICYATGLFLMDCILDLFTDKPIGQTVKQGLTYIGIIVASLILYWLIEMALLTVKEVALFTYQGMNTISSPNITGYLSQIPRAYRVFLDYFKASPFSTRFYQIIQVLFLFLTMGALAYLAVSAKLYRNWNRVLLLLLGVLLIPLALNLITLLVVGNSVHALMIYSFVLMYVFSLKIIELALQKMIQNRSSNWLILHLGSILLAGLLTWNNFCVSNMAYLRLQVCYENSFALANRIVARIEELDGYSPELPVAMVGEASRALYGGTVREFSQINSLTGTNDSLLYSSEPHVRTRTFINHYIGLRMPSLNAEQKELLNNSEAIKELPSYPQAGSIVIYDGIIVVKLSDGPIR